MNPDVLLKLESLSAGFKGGFRLEDISLSLHRSEFLGVLGESGSGKSLLSLLILGQAQNLGCQITQGQMHLESLNLLKLSPKEYQKLLIKDIGYIPQNCFEALNPLKKIQAQFLETLLLAHPQLSKKQIHAKILQAMQEVGLKEELLERYPFELSGGQCARVLILQMLLKSPKILICDEPTTALDPQTQKQVMDFLFPQARLLKIAIIFITHDILLLKDYVQRIAVMQKGRIIEDGCHLFSAPKADYTKELINSVKLPKKSCPRTNKPLLEVRDFSVFVEKKSLFYSQKKTLIQGVNFTLHENEILGVIGSSGSGKSSLALGLMGLLKTEGRMDFATVLPKKMRFKQMQIVLQNAFGSLNPRWHIKSILKEAAKGEDLEDFLNQVGLEPSILERYPFELSGGQCARVALARALIVHPKILIFDEPTASLDKSTQKRILELLLQIQRQHQLGYIFITHDMSIIESICDRVLAIDHGMAQEVREGRLQ